MIRTEPGEGAKDFEKLFEESFNRYFDSLYRYAFTLVKSSELATDTVQIIFIKWWETKTAVSNLDEARKYLFTAVYRGSLNVIRNEKTKQSHMTSYFQEQERETQFHDLTSLNELDLKIKVAIESLPPQCRAIFLKSRFEEKKYSEIATDMNLSVKTIEAQMGKALRILREKLIIES